MDNAIRLEQLKKQIAQLEQQTKQTEEPPEQLMVKESASGFLYLGEYHTYLGSGTTIEREEAFKKIDAVREEIRKRNGQK